MWGNTELSNLLFFFFPPLILFFFLQIWTPVWKGVPFTKMRNETINRLWKETRDSPVVDTLSSSAYDIWKIGTPSPLSWRYQIKTYINIIIVSKSQSILLIVLLLITKVWSAMFEQLLMSWKMGMHFCHNKSSSFVLFFRWNKYFYNRLPLCLVRICWSHRCKPILWLLQENGSCENHT